MSHSSDVAISFCIPLDRSFRAARVAVRDEVLGGLIEEWVADVDANYAMTTEGDISPQPDGFAPNASERWRIMGHRLDGGSVMPCRGSHRIRAEGVGATKTD